MSDTLMLQKARKEYKCTACGNKIPKGNRYWRKYNPCLDMTLAKEHINCELYKSKEYRYE